MKYDKYLIFVRMYNRFVKRCDINRIKQFVYAHYLKFLKFGKSKHYKTMNLIYMYLQYMLYQYINYTKRLDFQKYVHVLYMN